MQDQWEVVVTVEVRDTARLRTVTQTVARSVCADTVHGDRGAVTVLLADLARVAQGRVNIAVSEYVRARDAEAAKGAN